MVIAHAPIVAREDVAVAPEEWFDKIKHRCELREDNYFVVGGFLFENLEEIADFC